MQQYEQRVLLLNKLTCPLKIILLLFNLKSIIYGLIKTPENPQNTINFGVATSVLKHTIKGDVNCVSEQEVLSLVSEGANGRIKR